MAASFRPMASLIRSAVGGVLRSLAARLDPPSRGPVARVMRLPERGPLPAMPSLEVVGTTTADELAALIGHAESLDTKAGVVLGFAGVLVGLVVRSTSTVALAGLATAAAAALFAAASYMPRRWPILDPAELRAEYLGEEPERTRLDLLDTRIDMVHQQSRVVRLKGRLLMVALGLLFIAVALVVAGTIVGGGSNV